MWRKGFDANLAAARLAGMAIVSADGSHGGFGYLDFEYMVVRHEGNALLGEDLLPDERLAVVRRACQAAARQGDVTAERLAGEILRERNAVLDEPVRPWRVISDVSIGPSVLMRRTVHRDSVYTLHPKLSRTAREGRTTEIEHLHRQVLGERPTGYSTLSVSVRSRRTRALEDGLHRLELLRALWNLQSHRRSRRLSGGRPQQVNNVGFGPLHTLHRADGALAGGPALIDTRYHAPVARLDKADRFGHMDTYARRALSALRRVPYADELERAIVRYGPDLINLLIFTVLLN